MRLEPWQMTAELTTLVNKLDYQFSNQDLLFQAFTHTSFAHEQNRSELSNERMEYLGDSVLSLLVTERLMEVFPDKKEGELSKLRSAIVNEDTLFSLSKFFRLGECLQLGKGEKKSGGKNKKRNLARVFEAFLGAIYLDSNYKETKEVFFKMINQYEAKKELLFSEKILESFDPKTKLQEEVLKRFKNPPRYESEEMGNQEYEVKLWIENQFVASALGNSKKIIEKQLAIKALKEKSYLHGEENAS